MITYQDQNFNSPDIKESAFLKSSLGTYWCHKLSHLSSTNFYKISNGQERKKEGKNKVQKFENVEDKRSFFGKIKSIFGNFLKVLFWWRNLMHYINIFYHKYSTKICLINLKFSKFLSWTLPDSFCLCVYAFMNFIQEGLLISLKLRSTLNLTLRLQTLHTLII